MRYGGSIRAYQAVEHEFADLLADVDSEDLSVYMPHRDDDLSTLFEVLTRKEWEN
jgi:hypothetical protein